MRQILVMTTRTQGFKGTFQGPLEEVPDGLKVAKREAGDAGQSLIDGVSIRLVFVSFRGLGRLEVFHATVSRWNSREREAA